MIARTSCFALNGTRGEAVTVEAYVSSSSQFQFTVVGLPDAAVKESRDRVSAALKNSGFLMPQGRTTVSLSPADLRKEGAAFDLPVALAIILASRQLLAPDAEDYLLMGELALDGRLLPIHGALPMVLAAHEGDVKRVILPRDNGHEVEAVEGMQVFPASSLFEVAQHLSGRAPLLAQVQKPYNECIDELQFDVDLEQVRGQHQARRALEIAAAGGHNLLMIGVPGSGKTLLARCLPGILPPMTREESFETTRIHSVSGLLRPGNGLITQRPFRTPHHSASMAALIGGGTNARPGEVSLAHNGVLFLDEMPEYSRQTLEALRQPLEDGITSISRVKAHTEYLSRCMLVAGMNPCPCGYYGSRVKPCRCGSHEIRKYLDRISGPLLDRIDIQVEVDAVDVSEIADHSPRESSHMVRERVALARERQRQRFLNTDIRCNAQMQGRKLEDLACLGQEACKLLQKAVSQHGLSMRAYGRMIKVARTIADLKAEDEISLSSMAEALQFRMLDSKYWGGANHG